jgi:phosphoesterase RecJ-like protein
MPDSILSRQIFHQIGTAQRILLLTDERPDGDTIGSALAMAIWLMNQGKYVRIFSPNPVPDTLRFLPSVERIQQEEAMFDERFDLVMIFDCSDGLYLKKRYPRLPGQPPLIVFDHHAGNNRYGTINVVETHASSTGEILWQFFKTNRVHITKEMAENLLAAICYDTTHFTNDATNHVCLEAAFELGLQGGKLHRVVKELYINKSIPALKLWGVALERLTELTGGVLVTCLREKDVEETGAVADDVSGIANFLIAIVQDARVICVLHETADGGIKGSLRSIHEDVGELAKRLGGGGHKKASGFKMFEARFIEKNGVWAIQKSSGTILPLTDVFDSPQPLVSPSTHLV